MTSPVGSVLGYATVRHVGAADDRSPREADEVDHSQCCTARLARLFDSGKLSDVTLIVSGRRYHCHRLLLASASSVLE